MEKRSSRESQDERFVRLTEEYYVRIRRLARKFARSDEEGEDLTQDILLALYKGLKSFRGESALGTWVYKVAWTTALAAAKKARSEVRRRFRQGSGHEEDSNQVEALELLAVAPATQLAEVSSKERVQALREAISTLPREMRRVVQMRLQDRKYHEIATVLQISEETVKKQLSLARARLRDVLGEVFREEDV